MDSTFANGSPAGSRDLEGRVAPHGRPDPSEIFFATPVAGVFISPEGELRSGVGQSAANRPFADFYKGRPKSATVLNVAGNPSNLQIKAVGEPDLMGEMGIPPSVGNMLKLAAQAGSMMSGIGAGISFALDAMKMLGLFGPEPNPFDELFDRLAAEMRQQLKVTLGGITGIRMLHIADTVGHAETAGQIAAKFLGNPSETNASALPEAVYGSLYAVNTLLQESYWLRTYDPATAPVPAGGQSGWQFGPSVDGENLVWDWRLALPALLKTILARMAVVSALPRDPGYESEFLAYASRLREIEQRIRAGFARAVPLPYPGYDYWEINARDPVGVIDVYSGAKDMIGGWTPLYWFRDEIDVWIAKGRPVPTTYAEYVSWHEKHTEQRYWRLYDSLGLFSLWTLISDLETFARARGKAPLDLKVANVLKRLEIRKLAEPGPTQARRLAAYAQWRTTLRPGDSAAASLAVAGSRVRASGPGRLRGRAAKVQLSGTP